MLLVVYRQRGATVGTDVSMPRRWSVSVTLIVMRFPERFLDNGPGEAEEGVIEGLDVRDFGNLPTGTVAASAKILRDNVEKVLVRNFGDRSARLGLSLARGRAGCY